MRRKINVIWENALLKEYEVQKEIIETCDLEEAIKDLS